MTEKHTPRPWRAKPRETDGSIAIVATDIDGTRCQIARVNCHPGGADWEATTWANARLIASAVNCFDDLLTVARMASQVKGQLSRTLGAKANAAIAKATADPLDAAMDACDGEIDLEPSRYDDDDYTDDSYPE